MPDALSHILVIDDNEEILVGLSILLIRKAFKVSTKSKMNNFEKEVKCLSPDLILPDKNLGWADGCDLCKSLKTNGELFNIPVIMISAYYRKREECLKAGANNFLEKPFEFKTLLTMIDTLQKF